MEGQGRASGLEGRVRGEADADPERILFTIIQRFSTNVKQKQEKVKKNTASACFIDRKAVY